MIVFRVFLQCVLLKLAIAGAIQATLIEDDFDTKPTGFGSIPNEKSARSISSSTRDLEDSSLASNAVEMKYLARSHDGAPSPTQPGLISSCDAYYLVKRGDYCDVVISKFGNLTLSDFYSWNPSVKSNCSQLLAGYYVCVGISNTAPSPNPTTITAGTAAIEDRLVARAPTPTQSGIAKDCNDYYEAVSGDSCVGIANSYRISLDQFYNWNPAVGSNCQALLAGYYVCVGVAPNTTSTTPTTSSISIPTPIQSGVTSDCTGYYRAQSGDTCNSIIGHYSYLTLSTFESWNPAVGNDCFSLLAGYYYCVATPSVHA